VCLLYNFFLIALFFCLVVVVVCFGVHYFFFRLFGWLSFVFWFGLAVCSGCADSDKQPCAVSLAQSGKMFG